MEYQSTGAGAGVPPEQVQGWCSWSGVAFLVAVWRCGCVVYTPDSAIGPRGPHVATVTTLHHNTHRHNTLDRYTSVHQQKGVQSAALADGAGGTWLYTIAP